MADDEIYSHHDSEVEPEDSASRRGGDSSSPRMTSPAPSSDDRPTDSHVSRSSLKQDPPSTPPSRHASTRSSKAPTPTTYVPSKKDRVRYSWQSIHEDEPNRPRIHIIKIVSNTVTASAGLGQGEALAFSLSPAGKRIAAYNSARLFVFQTAALPVNVSHEYALRRRPVAVEICDEANILAVLVDEHTVNIYDLAHNQARRMTTVRTDLPTTTIALSSTGGLLACAYEGGVEVFSLAPNALITDRRAVRSPKMDKLVFSHDDSTLLGTTTRIFSSATVVVSVPVFPLAATGTPSHQELKEAWCSGMLEPQNIRNSSHAAFMRDDGATTNHKLFAWNGMEDTFGILNAHDMVYSQVDFPVAISPPLSTCGGLGAAIHHSPSVDEHGNCVAMIVNDRTIRLYIVPCDVADATTKVEAHSIDHELDEEYGCPFTDLRWVHSRLNLPSTSQSQHQIRGRLVVVSPGGLADADQADHMVQDVESGRIILFDFDPQFAGQPGQTFVFHLGKAPPLTLEEEQMDVADEVALVRRRTVTSHRSNTLGKKTPSLGRAATTVSRRQQDQSSSPYRSISPVGSSQLLHSSPWRRRHNASVISLSNDASRSLPDLLEASELSGEPIEDPYVQGAPRSVMSLHRAATAVNAHRFQALEEQEAEAENPGELPLPAYTELPNQPLPGRYRALAGLDIPAVGRHVREHGSPVSAVATAPPTLPPTFPEHNYPPSNATLSPAHAASHGLHPGYSNPISPVSSLAPSAGMSDWSNNSPLLARHRTNPTLRTQPSWETVSTNAPTFTQPPSTLRSQPSWESGGAPSLFSPEMTQGGRTAPSSPQRMRPPQTLHGLGLQDFRHSLLVPADQGDEPEDRALTTASDPSQNGEARTHHQHRPPHVNAIQAVNHASANNLIPSQDPRDRRSNSSTGAVSAISSTSTSTIPRPPQSAGAVPYPVTSWYPPLPPSPLDPSHRPQTSRSKSSGPGPGPPSRAGSSHTTASSHRQGRLDTRPTAELRRSKSVGAVRRAWFKKQRDRDEDPRPELPRVGQGVRDEFEALETSGKKCVVM